jgi:hypothetical protein
MAASRSPFSATSPVAQALALEARAGPGQRRWRLEAARYRKVGKRTVTTISSVVTHRAHAALVGAGHAPSQIQSCETATKHRYRAHDRGGRGTTTPCVTPGTSSDLVDHHAAGHLQLPGRHPRPAEQASTPTVRSPHRAGPHLPEKTLSVRARRSGVRLEVAGTSGSRDPQLLVTATRRSTRAGQSAWPDCCLRLALLVAAAVNLGGRRLRLCSQRHESQAVRS